MNLCYLQQSENKAFSSTTLASALSWALVVLIAMALAPQWATAQMGSGFDYPTQGYSTGDQFIDQSQGNMQFQNWQQPEVQYQIQPQVNFAQPANQTVMVAKTFRASLLRAGPTCLPNTSAV